MNASRATRAIAVVALSLLALSGCRLSLTDVKPPGTGVKGETYHVKAIFADALNLPRQGLVKLDGVPVGQVESVKAENYQAVTDLVLRKDVKLPEGTIAELRQTAPLGELYVALFPPEEGGTGKLLTDGSVIDADHTLTSAGPEDALSAVAVFVNGGGIQDLKTIITEFNDALDGRQDDARRLLTRLNTLAAAIDESGGDIDRVISGLDRTAALLAAEKDTIAATLKETTPVVERLAGQTGDIVTLLREVGRLGATSNRVVRATKDDILAELRDAKPVLDTLLANETSFRDMLVNLTRFSNEFDKVAPGDYILIDLIAEYLPPDDPLQGILPIPDVPNIPDLLPGVEEPDPNEVLRQLTDPVSSLLGGGS